CFLSSYSFLVILMWVCCFVYFFWFFLFFFFFQAEDGIRDGHVTGVQTCALPILVGFSATVLSVLIGTIVGIAAAHFGGWPSAVRSEERRVGKECRSRWSPYH